MYKCTRPHDAWLRITYSNTELVNVDSSVYQFALCRQIIKQNVPTNSALQLNKSQEVLTNVTTR